MNKVQLRLVCQGPFEGLLLYLLSNFAKSDIRSDKGWRTVTFQYWLRDTYGIGF
jgi:hypothetical protein